MNTTSQPFSGKKLQVHAVEKYFIPVMAGIEVNMFETYRYLVGMNCDVTVHTSTNTLTESNVLPNDQDIAGIKVKRYIYGLFGYWPDINWDKADIVALHNFNVFPHCCIMLHTLLLKLMGKKKFKLFLTPHGGFTPEWSVFPPLTRLLKMTYHNTIGMMLINLAVDGVRSVSEWEKVQIAERGVNKNKIVVIDNGLDVEAFEESNDKVDPEFKNKIDNLGRFMVQIGRVYVIKNLETVIRALPKIPKDIKYVIAGPVEINKYPEYTKFLDTLTKELGLENRVVFLGVVTGPNKYYLIRKSLMMVHMALWESFCNVVHEALSQGKICIVADNTALKYLVKDGDTGYRIPTKDSELLADKINYVLDPKNTEENKRIQQNAKAFGLNNSWEAVATRMYKFYTNAKENL